ncbi:helix-turn-helix transcriptional regulator [Actinophytocola sp.]|uniref:helix-turn-helix transcriptional regulator n=1 Tax=Actinophytocola sp. TaxID=1872138 RepID=UPI002D367578|nr:helix-turn-helix transcriptional regulator [Actinophytocola sp.]HYQ67083.1 helix-turn-helix transcriptional regulator [Actinophytocola sp.]
MVDSFGALLRKCRLDAGISLGELSRRINYSKGQVSKIENGYKRPHPMFAKLCDRALGTDGVLAAALPPESTGTPLADTAVTSPDEVWVLELEDGSLRFTELPRRQVLTGAGALLGFAVARTARPVVDDDILGVLRSSFDQYRALGRMTSPSVVLAQVIAQVHTLRSLAVDNPEPMRSDLLLLAGRVAEFAGWMCQEAGQESGASHWTDQAVKLTAGRDPHMASFALFRHAEIALYRHDARQTVDLAQRAQQDQGASPRILGLAARCEAQGHALAGDLRGYQEALDRAAALLAIPQQTSGPVLGSSTAPDEVALTRAWALYELGRPGDAAELLDQQLADFPVSACRSRARFGVRRALAHAQSGEIDQACVAAREVLDDAARVDSATIRLDLRELSRTLSRWHTHRAVADLRQELAPMLKVPG